VPVDDVYQLDTLFWDQVKRLAGVEAHVQAAEKALRAHNFNVIVAAETQQLDGFPLEAIIEFGALEWEQSKLVRGVIDSIKRYGTESW